MATAVKRKLSGSTDGMAILIAATASPGTAIHTAVSGITAGTFDEIWLWAFNSKSVPVVLTIQFGSSRAPDHNIALTVAPNSGLVPAVPGLILQNADTVAAFADTTNVVTVGGFVNSITD